jgi:hypothetical protein
LEATARDALAAARGAENRPHTATRDSLCYLATTLAGQGRSVEATAAFDANTLLARTELERRQDHCNEALAHCAWRPGKMLLDQADALVLRGRIRLGRARVTAQATARQMSNAPTTISIRH